LEKLKTTQNIRKTTLKSIPLPGIDIARIPLRGLDIARIPPEGIGIAQSQENTL
jgi:hypothetical protein